MLNDRCGGFTVVEVLVALVILAAGLLATAVSTSRLSTASASAESEAVAIQAVDDRLGLVLSTPSYGALDSLFDATEDNVPREGFTRTTSVSRVQEDLAGGRVLDYTRVTVRVEGPGLESPITRSAVRGAP